MTLLQMLTGLGPVFYKLVYMSLTGLAAGTIVLLLRRLADKRFSPFWKYAMWLLVLAALVVPWRPQSRAAVLSPAEAVQEISFREDYNRAQSEYDTMLAQAPQLPQVTPEVEAARREATTLRVKALAFDALLPLLWLCGTAAAALFMGIGAIRLRRKVKRTALVCDMARYEALLSHCQESLGMKRRVRVVLQSHVGTPALLGVFRPVILLPAYAENMSDARLEYVILHELSHLKRGDGLVNALLLAIRAVYWFNPPVWLLLKFVREDMELANDAAVLKGMGQEARKEYSLSLVEVLMGCAAPLPGQRRGHTMLCMTDGKKNIERRIGMIQLGEFFKRRKWVIAVVAVLVIAGIAVLFLTQGINKKDRYFPMQSTNLSDLQSDEIVRRVAEITGAAEDDILVPFDNFGARATGDFDWYGDGTVSLVFQKNKRYYGCQLRIMPSEFQYFVTDTYKIESSAAQHTLREYLDALKYLPQAVQGQWDLFDINMSDGGIPNDDQPCILYDRYGLAEEGAWQIRLDVQPMVRNEQNDSHEGIGTDLLHLFYVVGYLQQGETKRFQHNKLVLEITNVAGVDIKTTTDDGTEPREYPVYTLYPGAQLIVESADMYDGTDFEDGLPHAKWFVYSMLPDEEAGEGDTYIPITDDMPPLTITPDMLSVFTEGGSVLGFTMYKEPQPALPPLTPTFLSVEQGREALKHLIWGSDGWWLDTQGDYIFAHFWRYIVRYDIKTNRIDKIIDLGDAPQYWWYASTYSPDGRYCVAQAQEFDGPGHTGKVLIDLKNETVKSTEQEHFPHSFDSNPYQVESRLLEHGYGWFLNDVEIKALRPYASTITEIIPLDNNRVGALMPVSADASGYLGYYKFAVIDLAQDKIVQECIMNVLDKGEEYPTYPNQPDEPEPLLIDYHLKSVTVMRARFPKDGRSSYDGFDIVKVVDAPAEVAGFEECLKRGAWEPADEGDWLKVEPSSPQADTLILYMVGENGQGLALHL
ncbi:MAG: M56 family metallopeptidase, partial [Firmicutes bacterium]|nr:M56 family metallopeptidase [Bacillota bacterium]